MDDEGYPTELVLRYFETSKVDAAFLTTLQCEWMYAYAGYFTLTGDTLELSTAGWSGNEEIISRLMCNDNFWPLLVKERRGGHYTFELPKGWGE